MKRVMILAGGYLYFLFVYFGAGSLASAKPAVVLTWDLVHYIPTISAFTPVYVSVYFLPIFLLVAPKNTKDLLVLAPLFASVITLCGIIFLLMPLTLPRPAIEPNGIFNKLLIWQYSIDRPLNMFPSLHISLSLLIAFVVGARWPFLKFWMFLWILLIALSTLFIKQHYVVDVAGALIVAFISWHIFCRLNPKFGA